MQGGCSVLGRATKSKLRDWDQPFGIHNRKKKHSLDSDTEGEWAAG